MSVFLPAESPSTMKISFVLRSLEVQSANFPGRVLLTMVFFRLDKSLAFLAASDA